MKPNSEQPEPNATGNGTSPKGFEPDALLAQLRASDPDDFRVCRTLLSMIERSAARMDVTDRLHLSRLVSSTGHSIELSTRKERGA